ncbi:MAG: hypothetical protein ABIF10_07555 [Candidatus Woesearchaeota archaeon]
MKSGDFIWWGIAVLALAGFYRVSTPQGQLQLQSLVQAFQPKYEVRTVKGQNYLFLKDNIGNMAAVPLQTRSNPACKTAEQLVTERTGLGPDNDLYQKVVEAINEINRGEICGPVVSIPSEPPKKGQDFINLCMQDPSTMKYITPTPGRFPY